MAHLPAPYKRFVKDYPDIDKAYSAFARACHEHGPLDEKTRRLVKLGVALGLRSEGAVKSHARRAMQLGASREEIEHAVLLGMTTAGFPGTIAALDWVREVVES
jgi:alkylhydroperoxidase/carboxymuconolactone decarboxylase family protein YurZ